jgi:hypothetical protein
MGDWQAKSPIAALRYTFDTVLLGPACIVVVLFHMPEYLPGPRRPAAGPGFLPRADLIGRLRDGLFTPVLYRTLAGYLPAFNETRLAFGLAPLGTAQKLLGEYHSPLGKCQNTYCNTSRLAR